MKTRIVGKHGPSVSAVGYGAMSGVEMQHAIFNMPNVQEITLLETIGCEVIPAIAG